MSIKKIQNRVAFSGNFFRGIKSFQSLSPNLQKALIENESSRQYGNKRYPIISIKAPNTDIGTYLEIKIKFHNLINKFKKHSL